MDTADTPLAFWSFSLAAAGYVALAAYLLAAGGDWRHNARTRRIGYAAILSAVWAVASLISASPSSSPSSVRKSGKAVSSPVSA